MTFKSILFLRDEDSLEIGDIQEPDFFLDLNLNQIVAAITLGKQEYNLQPYFYASLHDVDAIEYRQEVMQDLENSLLFEIIKSFAQKMRQMRENLVQAEKLYYKYQKERWFLDAVEVYCDSLVELERNLSLVDLKSRGFLAFRAYLADYLHSSRFTSLLDETRKLKTDLSQVKYCIIIKGNSVKVLKYDSEIDYSADVLETFAKFKQGAVKDYRVQFSEWNEMNHVEANILNLVAQLFPDTFSYLDEYCLKYVDFLDEVIGVFDREIQFYVAYLEHLAQFKRAGLSFCYPEITASTKDIFNLEGFDLGLAYKLKSQRLPIVCNDFYLEGEERIIVVSGPNQGGKTTFARTFGQLHFLACLGCPVPGRAARLFLYDGLFTHFEKEENIKNLRGKLQDDLVRIRDILELANSDSIIILNEIFTSTTINDAIHLSQKVMDKIIRLDSLCVWVTFIDELSAYSEKTVSMVSTVVPDNPAIRTYKILRKPADGLAYAISIAEKYHLTYDYLKERIKE